MTTSRASHDRVRVRVNTRTRRRGVNSCAHDQSLRANIASFRMLRCQHRSDTLAHIWTRTHVYMGAIYARTRRARACPTVGARARPFAHRGTNTCYTHTVNLAPRSNAGRIVPGLEDIKSLDYPIKSYSAPPPPPPTQNRWIKPPERLARGERSVHIQMRADARCSIWSRLSSPGMDQYSGFDVMMRLDMKAAERTTP